MLRADNPLTGKNVISISQEYLLLCSERRRVRQYEYQTVRGPHLKAPCIAALVRDDPVVEGLTIKVTKPVRMVRVPIENIYWTKIV